MRKPKMARDVTATQSENLATNTGNGPEPVPTPRKPRRTRTMSPPRPAFFIIQVLGEDGQPQHFDKKRIKILSVERSAEKVFEMIDGGEYEHALYLRGIVPSAQRPAAPKP